MAFETTRRLRFGDCDPSGIAYFPSYMNMLVGVTEDLFEEIGWPWPRLAREWRIGTPTVRLDVTFAKPGFEGDMLAFRCRVARIGTSSLDLVHEVSARELLWRAEQRLVATTADAHRAIPWPDPVRAALARHLETSDA
jgi:4-hydroxybenzoyl-CoA thioesterase